MGRENKKIVNLEEFVYEELKRAIINGKFLPGERLFEKKLSEEFDVSRTPIRRAMQRLQSELFLESAEGKTGIQVYKAKKEDLVDITNIRMNLEKMALFYAMSRTDVSELGFLLMEPITKMRKAIAVGNVEEILETDDEFHRIIYKTAKNKWLEATGLRINEYFSVYKRIYLTDIQSDWDGTYDQHLLIYKFIMERNVKEATDLLEYHISFYRWKCSE